MGGKPDDFPLDEGRVCADADEVNDDDFEGTEELFGHLEQELGHATARSIEEALDQQKVRETLLPPFFFCKAIGRAPLSTRS